jgi:hypothetical protein
MNTVKQLVGEFMEKLDLFQRRMEKRSNNSVDLLNVEGFALIQNSIWTLACLLDLKPELSDSFVIDCPQFLPSICSFYTQHLVLAEVLSKSQKESKMTFAKLNILYFIDRSLKNFCTHVEFDSNRAHLLYDRLMEILSQHSDGDKLLMDAHIMADFEYIYSFKDTLKLFEASLDSFQVNYLQMSIEHIVSTASEPSGFTIPSRSKPTSSDSHSELKPLSNQQQQQQEDEEYINRLSMISSVKDLFPDLGDGFVDMLLYHFNDSVERVVSCLCDGSIPKEFETVDRNLKMIDRKPLPAALPTSLTENSAIDASATLALESDNGIGKEAELEKFTQEDLDLVYGRANVYDNDEFDLLRREDVDMSRVYFGKKEGPESASAVYTQKQGDLDEIIREKILNYSMYDDEYDDTLDDVIAETTNGDSFTDAAGAVGGGDNKSSSDPISAFEDLLMGVYAEDRAVFERTSQARQSRKREALKQRTNLSDEQIEGWKIMFERNVKKDDLLQDFQIRSIRNNRAFEQDSPSDDNQQGNPSGNSNSIINSARGGRGRGARGRGRGRSGGNQRKRGHDKKMQRFGLGQG